MVLGSQWTQWSSHIAGADGGVSGTAQCVDAASGPLRNFRSIIGTRFAHQGWEKLMMHEHWRQPRSSPRHVRDGCRASIECWDTRSTSSIGTRGSTTRCALCVVERLGPCHRDGEPLVLCPSSESSLPETPCFAAGGKLILHGTATGVSTRLKTSVDL